MTQAEKAPARKRAPAKSAAKADKAQQAPEAAKAPEAPSAEKKPYEPKQPGENLFKLNDVPKEMQDAAKQRFGIQGVPLQANTARENGTYKGEVLVGESYMAQKVGDNSVVFHKKSDVELASERHKEDPRRVNGAQLAIHYNGQEGKAYPYDRQREELDIVVNTMKKHAEKLGLGEGGKFAKSLEQVKESMWGDVEKRRAAQRETNTQRREERQQQRNERVPAGMER